MAKRIPTHHPNHWLSRRHLLQAGAFSGAGLMLAARLLAEQSAASTEASTWSLFFAFIST